MYLGGGSAKTWVSTILLLLSYVGKGSREISHCGPNFRERGGVTKSEAPVHFLETV